MKIRKQLMILGVGLTVFLHGMCTVHAQTPSLFVNVGGTTRNNVTHPDGANTNRVVLAPEDQTAVTYGSAALGTITIQALVPGEPAILQRVTDGLIDMLALHNVLIKRISGPVTNFPITFWGTVQAPPGNPPSYHYNLEADGSFASPANTTPHGDAITFTTSIKPSGGSFSAYKTWTRTVSCPILPCRPATFQSLIYQSSTAYGNLGSNPRELEGKIKITLVRNNETLRLNNGTGLKAKSGAQMDCDWIDKFINYFKDDPGNCEPEDY